MDNTTCPQCGRYKKPWFQLCWECAENEATKPRCEVCGIEVQDGHTLCRLHWKEKFDHQKQLQSIEYVKNKKETEFKEKFEGKYYFNSQMLKSKSELIICYFLSANGLMFQYEPMMTLGKEIRPDFVIEDGKGNFIIIEHFGMGDEKYLAKRQDKEREYNKLCKENGNFHFISTDEDDIYNLKDKLGKKLNTTPLKRVMWK